MSTGFSAAWLLLAVGLTVAAAGIVSSAPLILVVFATVNLSLIRVEQCASTPTPSFDVLLSIPIIGCVTAAAFAVYSAVDLLFL